MDDENYIQTKFLENVKGTERERERERERGVALFNDVINW
jgi:hypothetical protein